MGTPRSAIQQTIQQLDDDVAVHKRIARQNRDQAIKKSELRKQLVEFCEANGIPVEIVRRDA